ncbi:MAG: fibronectin [Ignavibacteriales bacterium CG_4_9_14_3_um_filter_34_10]|nr:MAG: fibronectin [Ignavibacteriales bacterium CG_4_9_14_3_um_filter_34_10]
MFRLKYLLITFLPVFIFSSPVIAQIAGTQTRYIRVGSLQSKFSAIGSERAWNNVYYEGLTWPSDYLLQDNAVIERTFMGCTDFIDAQNQHWDFYTHNISTAYEGRTIFPMDIKETAKFVNPTIYVDGVNISSPYLEDVDSIDENQIPDRIVTNIINTSMGITMKRRVLAFSQQYHDNYFIIEYTFKNTGYVEQNNTKVLNSVLKGFRFGFLNRYSVCREGADKMGYDQEYGKHSWVSKRGEDYPLRANEISALTESTPIPDWLRAGFEWTGQRAENNYDNIGSPDILTGTGRLSSPQFAGVVTLHVDKSTVDRSDDVNQPAVLGWHAGDTYPNLGDMSITTAPLQQSMYNMLSGIPYKGSTNGHPSERMDEVYMPKVSDPWKVHNDGGGTGLWISYGPWDIASGDSVVLVLAVGVNGLDRNMCWEIGKRWMQAYNNPSDNGPFVLPDGSTTTDENVYKNTWVNTGKDSIMKTFSRAVRNYGLTYNIPQPPLPPSLFDIKSGGDRISLSWDLSLTESEPGFGGYKIFRAVGKPDTTFTEIASLPPGTSNFDDVTANRGFSYYYYISAFSDGINNSDGIPNPMGHLLSSRFYTKTNIGAYLRRQAGASLSDIRIVPNPYNIRSTQLNYTGEPDKIMFLNIPGHCIIKIYTENGDLIKTIPHENGSGDERWNSNTTSGQVVVSGVYIVHFTVTEDYKDTSTGEFKYRKGDSAYKKLIIIR